MEVAKINRKDNKAEYDKQYRHNYYEEKKADIKARVSVKIPCAVCGKMIQKQHMSKHKKTKSCLLYEAYQQILINQ